MSKTLKRNLLTTGDPFIRALLKLNFDLSQNIFKNWSKNTKTQHVEGNFSFERGRGYFCTGLDCSKGCLNIEQHSGLELIILNLKLADQIKLKWFEDFLLIFKLLDLFYLTMASSEVLRYQSNNCMMKHSMYTKYKLNLTIIVSWSKMRQNTAVIQKDWRRTSQFFQFWSYAMRSSHQNINI